MKSLPIINSRRMCLTLLAASLLISGCASARRGEPLAGPLPSPSESVVAGKLVFDRKCGPCHPGGEAGVGPALNNKPLPRFLMKLQVRRGFGAMPSFPDGDIGAESLEQLIDYIVVLRRHPG